MLRQTDETLAQAVSNWRPRVTLSLEYNKLESDSYAIRTTPTFYSLNGKFTTLQMVQPLFRGGKTIADTKTAQANIQAQRAALADTEQNVLLAAVTSYADLVQNIAIADARRNNVRVLIQQLDATRERFRVGELTITDVSQAEARLEGARADLVQAEAQIRISEAGFQRTIGQKPGRLGEMPMIGGLPISEGRGDRPGDGHGPARRVGPVSHLGRELQRQLGGGRSAAAGQPRRRRPDPVRPAGADRPLLHLRRAPAGDGADLSERQRVVEDPPGQGSGRPAPQ